MRTGGESVGLAPLGGEEAEKRSVMPWVRGVNLWEDPSKQHEHTGMVPRRRLIRE